MFNMNLRLFPGTIVGMVGPSGCGKTTTVRLLTGIYQPQSGIVRVFGKRPVEFDEADKARIGYMPQHFILYPHLSAEENLHFMGGMYGLSYGRRRSRMKALLEFVEMRDARKRLGRQLSGGMKRRLMLAGALLHDPELIFADEPTAGIDPILRARIWENFRQLRDEGRTVLVTTQYVGEASYCDQVVVMRRGRLVAMDTPDSLRRQAYGGEIIHLQVDEKNIFQVMQFINDLPQVKKVEPVEKESNGIHVLVDDAGARLPVLLAALRENLDISPKLAEPHLPRFDEVFVRLVQQSEEVDFLAPAFQQNGQRAGTLNRPSQAEEDQLAEMADKTALPPEVKDKPLPVPAARRRRPAEGGKGSPPPPADKTGRSVKPVKGSATQAARKAKPTGKPAAQAQPGKSGKGSQSKKKAAGRRSAKAKHRRRSPQSTGLEAIRKRFEEVMDRVFRKRAM